MIKFGEYLPDQSPLENPGLTDCRNIIPSSAGYSPFPASQNYSTNALDARPQGGISVHDTTVNGQIFSFFGTVDKLYILDGAVFTDVSKGGGYATQDEDSWEFVIWGDRIIATNFSDPIQYMDLGAGPFADLGGSPPLAHHVDIVGNFLVVGNTYDATDGYQPARVRWPGIGTTDSWTVSATTQADFQDLRNEGGEIQKIVGGEFGLVFQQDCITRMSYIGSPLIFQFDLVESARGALCSNSVIKVGNNVAYLAQDGFFVFDGQQSIPIGDGKVDETFFSTVDLAYLPRMSVALYPNENVICWSYASLQALNPGMPDTILMYNYSPRCPFKWSYALVDTWFILGPLSQSYTLDGLDAVSTNLDTGIIFSLDSPVWMGVVKLLATFDDNFFLGLVNGAALPSRIVTGEAWLTEPNRSFVTMLRPHIDLAPSNEVFVSVGTRNLESQPIDFSPSVNLNSAGYAPVRANARFLSARFDMLGNYKSAQGFDIITTTSSGRR